MNDKQKNILSIVFIVIGFIILAARIDSQKIQLTTPVNQPSINDYDPGSILLQVRPVPRIEVIIINNAGQDINFNYPCPINSCQYDTEPEVLTLINTIGSLNLSTRNLWLRTFDRLVIDFPSRFPGAVTVQ